MKSKNWNGITAVLSKLLTCASKYRMKKFMRKLFPCRNAPASETITTFRSLIVSASRICFSLFQFKLNVWFTGTTIWMALAWLELSPPAEIQWHKMPITKNMQTIFMIYIPKLTLKCHRNIFYTALNTLDRCTWVKCYLYKIRRIQK